MKNRNSASKLTLAGLFLAIGILLPFVTSHGIGIPAAGQMFLPMHIPVLLCSFLCGPVYGGICGLILPVLNSILTGMPALFPNAVIMTFELLTYGIIAGLMKKYTNKTYLSLICAMISGRLIYGIVAGIILFASPAAKYASVITATVKGLPGIAIQLILIPPLVKAISSKITSASEIAVNMIKSRKATCVVVKSNKIIRSASPLGIKYILGLYDENILEGAFVADTVIGKAAAMVFTQAKISGCFGETVSKPAIEWLSEHNIPFSYTNCAEYIINRKGDGMCPMEETVKDTDNSADAIVLLKNKVAELEKEKTK